LGSSLILKNLSLAVVASLNYDSILRGQGLPILEHNVTELVETFISYGIQLPQEIQFGFSLKPTYKLEHYIEKSTAELFETPKIIDPHKNGRKGTGLGVDIGFSWIKSWTELDEISLGTSIQDIGNTAFTLTKNDHSPSPTLMSSNTGISYIRKFQDNLFLNSVETMYSYYFLQDPLHSHVSNDRIGFKAHLNYGLEFMFGSYKGSSCFGLQYKFKSLTLNYITFTETSSTIAVTANKRHGLSFHIEM
jgi:hypothetical protein